MEQGLNVASNNKKGARSFTRLNSIRTRMLYLARLFKSHLHLDSLLNVEETQLHSFFSDMRSGVIRRRNGQVFTSVKSYVQDFKAFWHWHQKVNRKNGIEIRDITTDLDSSGEKPKWVYMTEEDIKNLAETAKYEYKVLIWFLFDSGIRAPTELINVRVSDLYNNYKELHIRQETSKTFGRRIKLMLCSEILREYIKRKGLTASDYLFSLCPSVTNRYFKRLAKRVLGDKESPAGQKYSDLTMYDFRHCSCCYWLPRYKSESALKYRFGWMKSDKIHYYSELLGMRDTIVEEDILIDTTKTEIEKELTQTKQKNAMMEEKMRTMEMEMQTISELTKRISLLMQLKEVA